LKLIIYIIIKLLILKYSVQYFFIVFSDNTL